MPGARALAAAPGHSDTHPGDVDAARATKVEKPDFDVLDKNRDGVVSRDEAAAAPDIAQHFDAADRDRDGTLSRGEFDAALQRDTTGNAGAARGGSGT